jgi:hypothetical protein
MDNFNLTPDMFGLTGHGMRHRTIRGYGRHTRRFHIVSRESGLI